MDARIMSEVEFERRLMVIEKQLDDIHKLLIEISGTLVTADYTIKKVAAEVMPTLNEVMQSPMLRMLTGGKKK